MATRKPAAKKATWTADTLAEFKQSAAIVWRAQRSTSPTGDTFIGVRRFRVDAEGTEMPDGRCGIQVKEEGGIAVLTKVHAILGKLLKSLEDGSSVADSEDDEAPAPKKSPPGKSVQYVIQTKNGKFFQIEEDGDVKVVTKIKDATQMRKSKAEEVLSDYDASAGLTVVKAG